jgi:hypothetical protein
VEAGDPVADEFAHRGVLRSDDGSRGEPGNKNEKPGTKDGH